jgi:hypothetical protein
MRRSRALWTRVLHLSSLRDGCEDPLVDVNVHAQSTFRSLAGPPRYALYSLRDVEDTPGVWPADPGEHTLIGVREFRRVPLDASGLALTVFTARPGRAVRVVATLADFVERAVRLYQPGYLLLAHSREDPRTSLLLTALRDSILLGAAAPAAFNLDDVLDELTPLLVVPPESYEYCPPETSVVPGALSPYAV